jgi:hypothetical protein
MTPPGTCIAPHRTDPDRPRTALGGLRLCAGHHAALVEALTGPSAADDPTLDAVWGVRTARGVTIHGSRDAAAAAWAMARAFRPAIGPAPNYAIQTPPTIVCGDGETWHDPRSYRPGGLLRDYLTLATFLTGHITTSAAHVTGTPEWQLPINDPVAELRSQIRHDLDHWARRHATELKTTPPANTEPATLTAWLAVYTDWSAAQTWADDYLSVLTELRGKARALIDLPRARRIDVAACIEYPGGIRCTGRLWTRMREDADPTPPVIDCDTCEASYTGERWERLGKRIEADKRRTAA